MNKVYFWLALLLIPTALIAADISHTPLVPGTVLSTDKVPLGRPSSGLADGKGVAYTASMDQIRQYVQGQMSSATAATVAVGTVTTGAAGTDVIVTNSGTSSDAVLDFTIPRGNTGLSGAGSGDMVAVTYDPQSIAADAFSRTNHTGAQAISTVTGLQAALDAKAATSGLGTAAFTASTAYDVAGAAAAVTKTSLGLGSVDNTSDANKPVSTATQAALNLKASTSSLGTAAALSPSVNVTSLLGAADYATFKSLLGLTIGTTVQAYDADLTTYAGITPSANVQALLGATDYAAFRSSLGLATSATTDTTNATNLTTGTLAAARGGAGTVSGVMKANGSGTVSAAAAGTDYIAPYGSQVANYFLAAPNGSAGAPLFRSLVTADVPTLNQNTTGSAATLTTSRTINGVGFNGSANITINAVDATAREAALGNPGADGYVLSSTSAGSRSWVAQSGGVSDTTFRNYTTGKPTFYNMSTSGGEVVFKNKIDMPEWIATNVKPTSGTTPNQFYLENDATAGAALAASITCSGTDKISSYNETTGAFTCTGDQTGAGGSGITSLGGLIATTQTFANDTNVTVSSDTSTHTIGWTGTLAKSRGGAGADMSSVVFPSSGTLAVTTDNAPTATALYANGSNCPAGQSPLGVDQYGAVEGCWTPAGTEYTLPTASTTVLGGVKVDGTSVTISNGIISAPGAGGGTVTAVTGTAPIVSSGGTAPAISISAATTIADGSMSAADKTKLDGLTLGSTVQAYDADLTTFAGITPSVNVQALLGATDYAAFKSSLGLNSVENTALSTWAGSTAITTLGTIATGTVPAVRVSGLATSATTDTTSATNIATGTIAAARLPSVYIGTTAVDMTRASAGLTLAGITLTTPVLGTPTSATLTNATGLPVATGISGMGTGVATALATPSSANLAAALTDETGTGAAVFGTNPTISGGVFPQTTSATFDTTAYAGASVASNSITITNVVAGRYFDFSLTGTGTVTITTLTPTWVTGTPATLTTKSWFACKGTGANTADCAAIKENY